MQYKLIAMDMDGTLLNSQKEVSQRSKEYLKKASDMGLKLVVCTGRIFTSAKTFARIIGTKAPIVASNGAYIREKDVDRVIFEKHLKTEDLGKIINITKKYGLFPQLFTFDTIFSEKLIHSSLNYKLWNEKNQEDERVNIVITEDLFSVVKNTKILKVVVYDDNILRLNHIREEIKKETKVSIFSSIINNIEIMADGVSKGNAVKFIAEYFKIKPEEVICIGDNENDISMIKYAGLGVAMGNAEEKVKEIANYITDTNDNDGVAKVR